MSLLFSDIASQSASVSLGCFPFCVHGHAHRGNLVCLPMASLIFTDSIYTLWVFSLNCMHGHAHWTDIVYLQYISLYEYSRPLYTLWVFSNLHIACIDMLTEPTSLTCSTYMNIHRLKIRCGCSQYLYFMQWHSH